MALKLSATTKKVLDFGLSIAGLAVGAAITQGYIGGVVGLAAGYLVSDLIAEVDTGNVPVATILNQVEQVAQKEGASAPSA